VGHSPVAVLGRGGDWDNVPPRTTEVIRMPSAFTGASYYRRRLGPRFAR
jgi:hypothetical protein